MTYKYKVTDLVKKIASVGCCGSSIDFIPHTIKSRGIYTDEDGRLIPLYETEHCEFFHESQIEAWICTKDKGQSLLTKEVNSNS